MFVSSAPTSVIFRDGARPQLPAAQRPASHAARPADLLFAPAVGAQVVPAAPLQQHLDLPTPLFVHRDLPGEVGALVAAGGAQGRRGGGTGGEALQRAVVGGQVGWGGPFAVQLGALLLERRPGGEDLDVIARVLALGSLAFEPFFFCVRVVQRKRREGERNATGLFLFCRAATRFFKSKNRTESVGKLQGKVRAVAVKHNKQFLPLYQEKRQRLLVLHQTCC